MAHDDIRTLSELAVALSDDKRFADFQLTARGDGFIELRVGEGGVILAEARLAKDRSAIEPHLVRSKAGSTFLIIVGADDEFAGVEAVRDRYELAVVSLPISRARLYVTLKNYFDLIALRRRAAEGGRYRDEIGELVAISRALSSERDISKLLGLILEKSRYITSADAGSVYTVEGRSLNPRERTLRFVVSQNDSVKIDFREFTLPVDEKSIVGRSVIERQVMNIPNLYALDEPGTNPWGFKHDKTFDKRVGYMGCSMLTVPMVNQRDEVIGVIQLINKRKEGAPAKLKQPLDFAQWVIPFDKRDEDLSATLASQAGISLENTLLYEDIRKLFEGFVNASVTAIESRDPTTSGHSHRVAQLTVGLAETIDRETTGPFSGISFTVDDLKEIEYAGLLHDFGKVGVREKVLVKAKKLYEPDREMVLARFDFIRKSIEAEGLQRKLKATLEEGAAAAERRFAEIDEEIRRRTAEIDEHMAFVLKANEPTVLAEGSFERLAEIARLSYLDGRGQPHPYLREEEVAALKLPRGSLTVEERREIESHVVHTFNFLENIPWGRRLGKIPLIAGGHHEKLDGTGYPRGLKGEEIRVETRMMTIADIFDALTASDRPYKKAVPVEKALDIIRFEVKDGKCDADLFRIFV
ncbi:MAG TPA: HD domain-containing phosphohydrolase, partial [Polyangia bacterium]|nr:HD domain-containing phosphohydrolase [Polyangia bacterium]